MRVGVLGTGMVGKAIASWLAGLGHEVVMGSRTADNPEATAWAEAHEERAGQGTFSEVANALDSTGGMPPSWPS